MLPSEEGVKAVVSRLGIENKPIGALEWTGDESLIPW